MPDHKSIICLQSFVSPSFSYKLFVRLFDNVVISKFKGNKMVVVVVLLYRGCYASHLRGKPCVYPSHPYTTRAISDSLACIFIGRETVIFSPGGSESIIGAGLGNSPFQGVVEELYG